MRFGGVAVGVLLALMGVAWTLQGLNSTLVPRSFMTGSGWWVVIGLAATVVGITIAVWSWRHRRR